MKFEGIIGSADEEVVWEFADSTMPIHREVIFAATAGVVKCEVNINGTWYPVAIEDMASVTPATRVLVTTGIVITYRVKGGFDGVRFKQEGATASNVKGRFND